MSIEKQSPQLGKKEHPESGVYETVAIFPRSKSDPYETAPATNHEYPGVVGTGTGIYETAPEEYLHAGNGGSPGWNGGGNQNNRNNKSDKKSLILIWMLLAALIVVIVLLILVLFRHEHTWREATCASPRICEDCGETKGSALAHTWKVATCENAKTCIVCGTTTGTPLEHAWSEATCTSPQMCLNCRKTNNVYAQHRWIEATETAPKTCEVCGEKVGSAKGPVNAYHTGLVYIQDKPHRKLGYDATVEYKNRTETSVQLRIIWTSSLSGKGVYHSYSQRFTASAAGISTGVVIITKYGDWKTPMDSLRTVTVSSDWITVPLNTTEATEVNLSVYYYQANRANTDMTAYKGEPGVRENWRIPIPAY